MIFDLIMILINNWIFILFASSPRFNNSRACYSIRTTNHPRRDRPRTIAYATRVIQYCTVGICIIHDPFVELIIDSQINICVICVCSAGYLCKPVSTNLFFSSCSFPIPKLIHRGRKLGQATPISAVNSTRVLYELWICDIRSQTSNHLAFYFI